MDFKNIDLTNQKYGSEKRSFLLFLIMCMFVYLSVGMCVWVQPQQRPEASITSWGWSYKQLWAAWRGYVKLNSGPPKEWNALLATEPSF